MLDLLLAAQLDLVLLLLLEAVLVVVKQLLLPDLVLELRDLLFVRVQLVGGLLLVRILVHLDVVLVPLDLGLKLVSNLLLDQDFLRELDLRQLLGVLLPRLVIYDHEHADDAVVANREQLCVVVVQLQPLNAPAVCLNFKNLLEILTEDLDGGWPVRICHSSYKELSLETSHDLAVAGRLFVPARLYCFESADLALLVRLGLYLPDRFV